MPELTIPSETETREREETPRGAHHLPPDSDPRAILDDPKLDDEAKLARLRELEYDVRQLQVASEENMGGRSRLPALDEILAAIAELGPKGKAKPTPTKA